MKKKKSQKEYWEMSAKELAQATKQYDRPIPLSKTRTLTTTQKRAFERMRKSPQRSIFISRDAHGVWVRLEPDILRRSIKYAADQKMTLQQMINRSLKSMLTLVE